MNRWALLVLVGLLSACNSKNPPLQECGLDTSGCDDGDACTQDGCDAASGCTHTLDTAVCHHLAFGVAPPSEQLLGRAWPTFTVRVEMGDNAVSGVAVPVTVRALGGTGTLTGTTAVAGVAGVATFTDLRYDVAETITLEVRSSLMGALSHTVAMSAPRLAMVTAGSYYNRGIAENGELWCWGDNYAGQLGDGSNIDQSTPTRAGTASDWTAVVAGGSHTCGLKNGGELWCWGENLFGQLGGSTNAEETVPMRVGTANDWIAIAAGVRHTCEVKSNGELRCWGRNPDGQLGDGTAWVVEPQRVVVPSAARRPPSMEPAGARSTGARGHFVCSPHGMGHNIALVAVRRA